MMSIDPTTLKRWLIGGLIVAVAAVLVTWWAYSSFVENRSAKTEISLIENQTEATLESGVDAVSTVTETARGERETDAITKENDREIRNAEGANAPVTDTARDAGFASLCRRAAYREHPKCLQRAAAD